MENFVFECPFCGQKLECDESWENQKTQCPTCGKEIVPTKNAEIPASDKSKLSLEKRNVILGISGGFLAGFLISFAVFYLMFGFEKKEKTSEQKKPVKIVKSGNTFTQKTEAEPKAVKNVFVPVQKKNAGNRKTTVKQTCSKGNHPRCRSGIHAENKNFNSRLVKSNFRYA